MAVKKENEFEKLARLIKQQGEDIRTELKEHVSTVVHEVVNDAIRGLEGRIDIRFTAIDRKLDGTIQPQLDDHARRIKTLEAKSH